MATYTVTKIDWSNYEIGSTQHGTLEYKLWSDPVSDYNVVNNNVAVGTDGTLSVPEAVSGLTSGETYDLRFSNNCSSPVEYWVTTITAP